MLLSLAIDVLSLRMMMRGRINFFMWLASQVIDLVMMVMSFWNIYLWAFHGVHCKFDETNPNFFNSTPVIATVGLLLSGLILIRVVHMPVMLFFICCCAPCYMCPDNCCLKRRLLKS